MARKTRSEQIREFILEMVKDHPEDLVSVTTEKFGSTRQNIHNYLKRLSRQGKIAIIGKTKATRYYLTTQENFKFDMDISSELDEARVWQERLVKPLACVPENVRDICCYGFTEMLNNVKDHSEGKQVLVQFQLAYGQVEIEIHDDGVGVFKKIQSHYKLDSIKEAILHLSKGKVTTDPEHHSGEGIFFTSRMFDEFSIFANGMYFKRFKREDEGDDWLLTRGDGDVARAGTLVHLSIPITSPTERRKVFEEFSDVDSDEEPGFFKTQISINLAQGDNDTYVSRSQAKRVLSGAEKFKHVVLNFRAIRSVGQGFVDEVFRVFKSQHPHVRIDWINANEEVTFMIERSAPNRKSASPNT